MMTNSWQIIEPDSDLYALPEEIKQEDAFGARDIGWVNQMRPLIRDFTDKSDVILDPFSGLGTTLIAAKLEDRQCRGIEIESSRIELTQKRWNLLGFPIDELYLEQGDACQILSHQFQLGRKPLYDVCLTNLPYFGSSWQGGGHPNQLYSETHYDSYLNSIKSLCYLLRRIVKKNGYIIFTIENSRDSNNRLKPLAWDVGKLLPTFFDLYDERILLYKKDATANQEHRLLTNRAHEYLLVTKNTLPRVNRQVGELFLQEMYKFSREFFVFGSFYKVITGTADDAADIDLLMPNDNLIKARTLAFFKNKGYEIFCQERPMNSQQVNSNPGIIEYEHFFRCFHQQSANQVDIVFIDKHNFNRIPTSGLSYLPAKNVFLDQHWNVRF